MVEYERDRRCNWSYNLEMSKENDGEPLLSKMAQMSNPITHAF